MNCMSTVISYNLWYPPHSQMIYFSFHSYIFYKMSAASFSTVKCLASRNFQNSCNKIHSNLKNIVSLINKNLPLPGFPFFFTCTITVFRPTKMFELKLNDHNPTIPCMLFSVCQSSPGFLLVTHSQHGL